MELADNVLTVDGITTGKEVVNQSLVCISLAGIIALKNGFQMIGQVFFDGLTIGIDEVNGVANDFTKH